MIHLDEAVPEVKQTFFIVEFASYTSSMKGWPKFADILEHITKCDIQSIISHILLKFIYFNYYQIDGKVFYYRLVQLENLSSKDFGDIAI